MLCFNAKLRAGWGFINAETIPKLTEYIVANGAPIVRPEHRDGIREKITRAMSDMESTMIETFQHLGLTRDEAIDQTGNRLDWIDDDLINVVAMANDVADICLTFEGCDIRYSKTQTGQWLIITQSCYVMAAKAFEDDYIGGGWLESPAMWDEENDEPILDGEHLLALTLPPKLWAAYNMVPFSKFRAIEHDGEFTGNSWIDGE